MKHIVGWAVRHPSFLRQPPITASDLMEEIPPGFLQADFDLPDVYDNPAEAWQVEIENLTEMRDQALADIADIDEWSRPYISANRITYYTFPPGFVEQKMQEACHMLHVAEKGLALCPKQCV